MSATQKIQRCNIPKVSDPRIAAVLDYLSIQSPMPVASLESIAISLNLSPSRLRSIFVDHTGTSFCRYMKHLRMHRARKLLQETMLSVKQVRIEAGLADHSHFARDYKREFGESPTDTRRFSSELKVRKALGCDYDN